MSRRLFCTLLALALCASALGGCEKQPERGEFTTFAMDTVMDFTVYGSEKGCSAAHSIVAQRLSDYEALLSATREDSDISRVNRGAGQPVEVDHSVALLLGQALTLCQLTDGALDITAYPAVKAWGFTAGEHRVPPSAELAELAANIDYTAVRLEGDTVTLPENVEIDLGAVAKGYVGDVLAGQVGLSSALLDLGQSTIVAVGGKPDGSPWRVGIQDPAGEGYFAVIQLVDMAMGTSGVSVSFGSVSSGSGSSSRFPLSVPLLFSVTVALWMV